MTSSHSSFSLATLGFSLFTKTSTMGYPISFCVWILVLCTLSARVMCQYDIEVSVFVGTPQDDESFAVAHDLSKNKYLTGTTRGSLYGTNTYENATWFISGYNQDTENQLLASRQKSSSVSEFAGTSVVVKDDDNIVFCCGMEGTRGFLRAFNSSNLADIWISHTPGYPLYGLAMNPENSQELYVIGEQLTIFKFDANGTNLWNITLGSSASRGTSITVNNNTIYFTGYDNGDIVIGTVDTAGTTTNLTYYGSSQNDFGTGILFQNGSIFVAGYTDGNFSVDSQNLPSTGNFSVVVMSVDPETLIPNWIDVRKPEFGNAKGFGISQGLLTGTLQVVGYSDSSFGNQTGLGKEDILIATYTEDFGFDSAVLYGTNESDFGYGISVAFDLSDFYITGATSGQLDPKLPPSGGLDIFVIKVEIQEPATPPKAPSGKFNWLAIGIAAGFVGAGLLVGGAAFGMYKRSVRKFREKHQKEEVELPKMEEPPRKVSLASDWDISYPSLSIGAELGRGAFGVVYKCRWRNTDCVVKQLDLDRKDAQSIKAFLKEANNVRNLRNHPNVCSILGVCTNPEYPICIVMEYLPEGNLLDKIVESRLEMDLPLIVRFAKDVASGMSHLHDENILHCDLACRNLLVDSRNGNYMIKISDFGLSRVLEAETYTASASSAFPVRWTAPEALRGGKLSRASDVWSFGVTLWEMIEGYKPYSLMTNQEVITAVCDNGYRLPRPTHIAIPDSLYELMFRCWQTRPSERPTFNQIYEQLCQIEKELEIPDPSPPSSSAKSRYMNAQDIQSTFGTSEQTTTYHKRGEYEE